MNIKNEDCVEDIFVIKLSEVQYLAKNKFGRYLEEDEIKEVQKRIQWGLECWEDVVLYAISDVIANNNDK
ncbi:hypothetical protein [Caldisericum exile]|uniref:hypothetical protein n=1 Tax=Caldisericum exile TaxID=693075 RepID=UPI003C761B5C